MGRTPKTHASGTMTEAGFWGFIRRNLRRASLKWQPKRDAEIDCRREAVNPVHPRQKWEYQCSICDDWFPRKECELDHKIPAGSLKCAGDLPLFVTRLFCEKDGFSMRCKTCHAAKTQQVAKRKKSPPRRKRKS